MVDPATGEALCAVADAGPADGATALDAAAAAQAAWAATSPRERAEILRRAYELLHERIDDLALLMTLEMGKPLAEATRRDRLRRRVLPLVRRGGGAHRRRLPDGPRRRRAASW